MFELGYDSMYYTSRSYTVIVCEIVLFHAYMLYCQKGIALFCGIEELQWYLFLSITPGISGGLFDVAVR